MFRFERGLCVRNRFFGAGFGRGAEPPSESTRQRSRATRNMVQSFVFLASSFWLGALHAATPGHGKTIAAAYIVGARGRPVDALVLGIFVTLSHTSGIVLVAVLASLGSTWLIPHRIEAYLAFATGVLVIGIGLWMLATQRAAVSSAPRGEGRSLHEHIGTEHEHLHDDAGHQHQHPHDHPSGSAPPSHREEGDLGYHRHGW